MTISQGVQAIKTATRFLKDTGLSSPQMDLLRKANKFQLNTEYGNHYPTGMVQTFGIMDITLQILRDKGLIINGRVYTESEILTRELEVVKAVQEAKSDLLEGGTWKGALKHLQRAEALETGNKRTCLQITYKGRQLVQEFEALLPQETKGDL